MAGYGYVTWISTCAALYSRARWGPRCCAVHWSTRCDDKRRCCTLFFSLMWLAIIDDGEGTPPTKSQIRLFLREQRLRIVLAAMSLPTRGLVQKNPGWAEIELAARTSKSSASAGRKTLRASHLQQRNSPSPKRSTHARPRRATPWLSRSKPGGGAPPAASRSYSLYVARPMPSRCRGDHSARHDGRNSG